MVANCVRKWDEPWTSMVSAREKLQGRESLDDESATRAETEQNCRRAHLKPSGPPE